MKYLTYLNSGCKDICDNMLKSATINNISLQDFIIVAFDRPIFDYYQNKGIEVELFCDVAEEPYHEWTWDANSKFRELVKNKWILIKKYFNQYSSICWLDTDVVFLKNPSDVFKTLSKPTFQIDYPALCACTGLMYFPDCDYSRFIIENLGNQNTEDDQLICNNLLQSHREKYDFFDLNLFPNGGYFYDKKGTTIEQSIMHHCNYIVGLNNKINRLKNNNMWFI
jgi:hypothetical protein